MNKSWEIHMLGKQGRSAMLSIFVTLLLRYLRLRSLFSKTKSLHVIDLCQVVVKIFKRILCARVPERVNIHN